MTLSPLVSAGDLLAVLHEPKLRIVDCRFSLDLPAAGRAAYTAGHIPGASYASLDEDLVLALANLGYKRSQAERAVTAAHAENPDGAFHELLRASLSRLSRA